MKRHLPKIFALVVVLINSVTFCMTWHAHSWKAGLIAVVSIGLIFAQVLLLFQHSKKLAMQEREQQDSFVPDSSSSYLSQNSQLQPRPETSDPSTVNRGKFSHCVDEFRFVREISLKQWSDLPSCPASHFCDPHIQRVWPFSTSGRTLFSCRHACVGIYLILILPIW
jgi:hypothetical protein